MTCSELINFAWAVDKLKLKVVCLKKIQSTTDPVWVVFLGDFLNVTSGKSADRVPQPEIWFNAMYKMLCYIYCIRILIQVYIYGL